MIITRALRSHYLLLALVLLTVLDLGKPGYLQFMNIQELLPKECTVAQTFEIPNLPWLQTGLSKSSTLNQWKRRLGKPTCYQGKEPLWELPGAIYLKLSVNENGIIKGYQFYR
jgi:hypothetical protein